MELVYIHLDTQKIKEDFSRDPEFPFFDEEIPLPYVQRNTNDSGTSADTSQLIELSWDCIVDGILYIALYEPNHEHCRYYKDFLLGLEPEFPHILRERLQEQYQEFQWEHAQDTVHILRFLLPEAIWPILEQAYLYEQQAEQLLLHQKFSDSRKALELASICYQSLLLRDDLNPKAYYQLGFFYLQSWNFSQAHSAFVWCQQLALSPEHPLWARCDHWLQQLYFLDSPEYQSGSGTGQLEKLQANLYQALEGGAEDRDLWLEARWQVDTLLEQQSSVSFFWFLRGLCLLFSRQSSSLPSTKDFRAHDTGQDISAIKYSEPPDFSGFSAAEAFARAAAGCWETPIPWQLPYYHGVSLYLESKSAEAEKCFLQIVQSEPEHSGALYWLGKIYEDRNDHKARQYQVVLNEIYPGFPDLLQFFLYEE